MKSFFSKINRYLFPILNTRAGGIYILLFAASIGIATFIENDFGTSAAQKVVYQTWWFELLLFLFGASILFNIYKFRMIKQQKWALLLFHSSILIILMGAGITRYISFEGMMHIREGSSSNLFLSRDTYLNFQVEKGEDIFEIAEPVLFASLGNNDWKESYLLGEDLLEIEVQEFIPNPKPTLYESVDGKPMLKLVVAGSRGREEYFLEEGQRRKIGNVAYNFGPSIIPGAINLKFQNDALWINSPRSLIQTVMATQQKDTLPGGTDYYPLRLRSLYFDGRNNFVFAEFKEKGKVKIESTDPKVKNGSISALNLAVTVNGEDRETYVYGRIGSKGKEHLIRFGEVQVAVSYGSKEMELPFEIGLYDFELERYPGTQSPASYASEVQLIDPRNSIKEDHRIYMNHILDYEGYRFFQSSYDNDEKGTYLSVNHDFWGTSVSYFGYALLTLGMIMTFFSKKTRFYQVQQKIKALRKGHATLLIFLMISSVGVYAEGNSAVNADVVDRDHAAKFSRLVVQDFKGRMKPIHTLSREVLRKIYRKEGFQGATADQVLLSLFAKSKEWYSVPLIKLGKHKDLEKKLGLLGTHAAYKDFFDKNGSYNLQGEMRRIQSLAPIDRGVYEKELLKIDERVNILNMLFSGHLLRIVPKPNDANNTWLASHKHGAGESHNHKLSVADNFFQSYKRALQEAMSNDDYREADAMLEELEAYQQEHGGEILPSQAQLQAEILLNQSSVFNRLTGLYMLLGLGYLSMLFISVFKPTLSLKTPYKILFSLTVLGFVLYTIGLGLRWYVSGRAPWSNGYESMIYIGWTTTLAGLLFTRKSLGGLAATMILAGTILFVSMLSFLDPEITPLVPVLRSYWLTIHVSLEAGSYGFLMLGAIIGLINLSLMTFLKEGNHQRINELVKEMSYLSELTLISGLFMISIGTYLGGVWANESWGRYWGWDAKETWALVSILVYSFILHMRIIPKVFGLFSYNLASIFGLASIIMTYYGVNYYLSGLHSYASGDPVPIPSWVYVFVGVVSLISALAFRKTRQFRMRV